MTQGYFDVSVVTSVYNEEEVLEAFYKRACEVLEGGNINYEIVFVDDGSRDRSFDLLKKFQKENPRRVKVVRLARNFGHQLGMTAGIRTASGNAVIVTDCDLQDPPEVILKFIDKWREGHDIVYGIRTERKGETAFKKFTAHLFYKMIRAATKIDIPENVGDFYLLDRKIVEILNGMEERHRFMRGIVAWVGFKRVGVSYVREPRFAGQTKYSLWKMVKFSFDAATSFSFLPLRAIALIGALISIVAFLGIVWAIFMKLFTDATILGWASLMVAVLFVGGIQLLAIGVIGEYVARIGDDVKRRPLYTVKEILE